MAHELRITTRNARFQQWQALLANRAKRAHTGEFIVQGVRPITLAVRHGWPVRALLYPDGRQLSQWARGVLDTLDARRFALAPELIHELGGKSEETPELVAVVGTPPESFDRIGPVGPDFLAVVFDRPTSPGNIGTLIRSADAFGATAVLITGHAADPYDPRSVRASTGSLFSLPVVRAESHREVLDWLASLRGGGLAVQVIGTDEHGQLDIARTDLVRPTLALIGNETAGLSAAWRGACDHLVRIPIGGSASSLNAAAAGTVVLYEAARQRRAAGVPPVE